MYSTIEDGWWHAELCRRHSPSEWDFSKWVCGMKNSAVTLTYQELKCLSCRKRRIPETQTLLKILLDPCIMLMQHSCRVFMRLWHMPQVTKARFNLIYQHHQKNGKYSSTTSPNLICWNCTIKIAIISEFARKDVVYFEFSVELKSLFTCTPRTGNFLSQPNIPSNVNRWYRIDDPGNQGMIPSSTSKLLPDLKGNTNSMKENSGLDHQSRREVQAPFAICVYSYAFNKIVIYRTIGFLNKQLMQFPADVLTGQAQASEWLARFCWKTSAACI